MNDKIKEHLDIADNQMPMVELFARKFCSISAFL